MVKEEYWKKKIKSVLSDYRRVEYARLKRYSKLIKDHTNVDEPELMDKLRSKGFKEAQASIWINKSKNIVIKYNGLSQEGKTKFAIPTVNLGYILVQPLARVRKGNNDLKNEHAYNILKRLTVEENLDLHDDNIGWWKGVPLMIDW